MTDYIYAPSVSQKVSQNGLYTRFEAPRPPPTLPTLPQMSQKQANVSQKPFPNVPNPNQNVPKESSEKCQYSFKRAFNRKVNFMDWKSRFGAGNHQWIDSTIPFDKRHHNSEYRYSIHDVNTFNENVFSTYPIHDFKPITPHVGMRDQIRKQYETLDYLKAPGHMSHISHISQPPSGYLGYQYPYNVAFNATYHPKVSNLNSNFNRVDGAQTHHTLYQFPTNASRASHIDYVDLTRDTDERSDDNNDQLELELAIKMDGEPFDPNTLFIDIPIRRTVALEGIENALQNVPFGTRTTSELGHTNVPNPRSPSTFSFSPPSFASSTPIDDDDIQSLSSNTDTFKDEDFEDSEGDTDSENDNENHHLSSNNNNRNVPLRDEREERTISSSYYYCDCENSEVCDCESSPSKRDSPIPPQNFGTSQNVPKHTQNVPNVPNWTDFGTFGALGQPVNPPNNPHPHYGPPIQPLQNGYPLRQSYNTGQPHYRNMSQVSQNMSQKHTFGTFSDYNVDQGDLDVPILPVPRPARLTPISHGSSSQSDKLRERPSPYKNPGQSYNNYNYSQSQYKSNDWMQNSYGYHYSMGLRTCIPTMEGLFNQAPEPEPQPNPVTNRPLSNLEIIHRQGRFAGSGYNNDNNGADQTYQGLAADNNTYSNLEAIVNERYRYQPHTMTPPEITERPSLRSYNIDGLNSMDKCQNAVGSFNNEFPQYPEPPFSPGPYYSDYYGSFPSTHPW